MADEFHLLFPLLPLKQPPSGWGYVPGHLLHLPPRGWLHSTVLHLLPDSGKAQDGPARGGPEGAPLLLLLSSVAGTTEEVKILSTGGGVEGGGAHAPLHSTCVY